MTEIFALIKRERGSVAVLAAIAMTALLSITALVTDVGLLYLNRTQLTSVADAAALAGALNLPGDTDAARASALQFAAANGKNGDNVTVGFADGNRTITVQAVRSVDMVFAKIFGLTNANVTAAAAAAVQPISTVNKVVPFGIVWNDFVYGQSYNLKEGAGSGYSGNYGALALGGSGASTYRNNIINSYNGRLKIGQHVPTETGNMSGPTANGVRERIRNHENETYDTADKDSSRLVVVPVIDSLAVNGSGEVTIVGFAMFFLEGVGGNGTDSYVTGTFIHMYIPGESSSDANNYGLVSSALVK